MPASKPQRKAVKILLKEMDEIQWHAILTFIDAFTLDETDEQAEPFPVRVVYVNSPERSG